jgi:thiol-disulfide isomerase/thioredoxin
MSTKIWIISYIVLWVFVIIQTGIIYLMFKNLNIFLNQFQNAEGVKKKQDLTNGSIAPPFSMKSVINNRTVKIGPENENTIILVFVSSTCPSCLHLLQTINDTLGEIVFISQKKLDSKYTEKVAAYDYPYLVSSDLFQKYQINGVPKGVVIEKGIIKSISTLAEWKDISFTSNKSVV